jgi:hypothetical protein
MKSRHALLLVALVATLASVWWVEQEDATSTESEVVAAAPRLPEQTRASVAPRPDVSASSQGDNKGTAEIAPRFPGGGADLFPATSWRPPPPPPAEVVVQPPPPPMAPPLPFKYLGRWADSDGDTVFLAIGERLFNATAGQRLEQWRLDKVGADSLDFTYLPLDQQRKLRLKP